MIDQIPWHEMNINDELTLKTSDPFLREIEDYLRKTIYRWEHMRTDLVITDELIVPKVFKNTGFGIEIKEEIAVTDPANDVVGHSYEDQIKSEKDIEKIHTPEISLDIDATSEREEICRKIFDGILKVRMQGFLPSFAPWDVITQWHGVENTLVDLAERPEFMHRLVDHLTNCYLKMLDNLEKKGFLGHHQTEIHCTGAWTDELPKPGFNPEKPRTCDLWTFGMAQIFGFVSPKMHDEFEIPYMQKIYSRFGLGYYGCCEPLDDRIDLIRKIPNVRKISMSPWVNEKRGAEHIKNDFVFSRKPPPSFVAKDHFNEKEVEEDLKKTIKICKENNCPLELILKDISTVRYEPQRLYRWAEIARRLVTEEF